MRKLKLSELGRISLEEYKVADKTPLVVVLDNVRSALNVGSAFRTSDAFRIEKIVLCGITAKPPHRDINRSAIGATDSVDWSYNEDIREAILKLKEEKYTILAIEQTDYKVFLQDYSIDIDEKYALIFGNEVSGVSTEILDLVDACIEIPQIGTKHSLNISVCLGVVLWEFYKKYQS